MHRGRSADSALCGSGLASIPPTFGESYFTFLPASTSEDLPSAADVVAETFGFSCLGFLFSLVPRLLLPLDIGFPSAE